MACIAAPFLILTKHLGKCVAASDAEDVVGARYSQRDARFQTIDVALEGIRVGLEYRQHGLVDREARVGSNLLGNTPQRIATNNLEISAGCGVETG